MLNFYHHKNYENAREFYRTGIYNNVVDIIISQKMDLFKSSFSSYADGEKNETDGKNGMRALAVPPIALAFSVFGALVHVFKLIFFTFQAFTGRGFTNGFAKLVVVFGLALTLLSSFYYIPMSSITKQDGFVYFENQGSVDDSGLINFTGSAAMFFARSVIHAQPVAYPIFEFIRVYILRGVAFGYESRENSTMKSVH